MKTKYIISVLFFALFISCNNEESIPIKVDPSIKTEGATDVSVTSSMVSVSLKIPSSIYGHKVEYGIILSTEQSNLTYEKSEFKSCSENPSSASHRIILKGLLRETTYYYRGVLLFDGDIFYGEISSFRTTAPKCPEGAIDLGLSVCWAKTNIGAESIEDYGDYYAWGDVETYYRDGQAQSLLPDWKERKEEGYSTMNYKWGNMFDGYNKYYREFIIGERESTILLVETLEKEDDAAYFIAGGSWRMPKKSELQELLDNCSFVWTNINGINGYKISSNINGFLNNWIFIPASGIRQGKELLYLGELGYCWLSSLDSSLAMHGYYPERAFTLSLSNSEFKMGTNLRYYGCTVRPVSQ